MPIQRIQPQGLPNPPIYAHVVKTSGNIVFIAGQVAQDEKGNPVGKGDIAAQATQVFENLKKALASVGAGFENVVKATYFVTDSRYREAVGEVRAKYLVPGALPASTFLVVAGLASPDYLLEVEFVAVVD